MEKIEWSKDLEIGNFEIDSQHITFIGIINKISKKVEEKADERNIELLLVELLKYTEFHFCSEENIMIEVGFPGMIAHKHEHERVLAELRNRIFSLKYEYIDFGQLQEFLVSWFITHTTKVDIELAKYMKNL